MSLLLKKHVLWRYSIFLKFAFVLLTVRYRLYIPLSTLFILFRLSMMGFEHACESSNLTVFLSDCKPRLRVNYSNLVNLDLALPIYGYLVPIFVLIMLVTNISIIAVFSCKHMRTPANSILLGKSVFLKRKDNHHFL